MASSRDSQPGASIYTPLDKATRSIRLLRFTEPPVGSEHDLHFTLTVHKLPTADEQTREDDQRAWFIALSYVWGPAKPEHSIIVNGKRLKIRENLYALLQVLHKPTHVSNTSRLKAPGSYTAFSWIRRKCPYIWADAICIDQKAGEEKNHQVNMMGDIYLQAVWVVCWLGPAADDSKLAMDWLRDARHECLRDPSLGPPEGALGAILERPYWQRLWIVQEFALAMRPLLLCGQSMVSLCGSRGEMIISTVKWWAYPTVPPAAVVLLSRNVPGTSSTDSHSDLHSLVLEFEKQECEKPQDRIFALLAFYYFNTSTLNADIPRITADYNVTPERLFYRVLADCSTNCGENRKYAEDLLQGALQLPHCKVENPNDAYEFIHDVLGREDFRSLHDCARHTFEEWSELYRSLQGYTSDQLTKHEILQKAMIRECSVEKVTGHLKRLTGLTREDILKDPEGVYLEVLGRLFHYDRRAPLPAEYIDDVKTIDWIRGGSKRTAWIRIHESPGISVTYTFRWEVFTNVLRRTLGMPLIDYAFFER